MHILLTGGTGLVGRALCAHWLPLGHRLSVWSRTPERVPQLCGAGVNGIGQLAELNGQPVDVVINLAGAPVAARRWTAKRKKQLWQSRIGLTEQLLDWLAQQSTRPECLISGSSIGWYGNGGESLLDEDSQPATHDFASALCAAWEETAQRAETLGIRVVLIRTGLVLSKDGGFLGKLLPVFRMGLGGRMGNGQQWMPWIHIRDQVASIDFLMRHPEAKGPYNVCAPAPTRNQVFTHDLGRVLHRPAVVTVPAMVLRLLFGELAELLLGGQRAMPARLSELGFRFHFDHLDVALSDVLKVD